MKKKFMENKKFRLIAVFLVTVLIVTGFSFAWFYIRQTQANVMSVSNLKATPVHSFAGTDDKYVDEDGLILLSTDPDAPNYIGNFRVNVEYEGDGWGYLRVRLVHEISIDGVSVQHPAEMPYATTASLELSDEENSFWLDNRSVDSYYYYKDVLNADETEIKELPLILGLVKDYEENEPTEKDGEEIIKGFAESDVVIKVAIETDMVQVNRYPQIWGIDKLPWK